LSGAFEKLRQETISFVMSVYSSLCVCLSTWNSAPTGRIVVQFDIRVFFEKSVEKIKVSFKICQE